jgi:hypothetical protein
MAYARKMKRGARSGWSTGASGRRGARGDCGNDLICQWLVSGQFRHLKFGKSRFVSVVGWRAGDGGRDFPLSSGCDLRDIHTY